MLISTIFAKRKFAMTMIVLSIALLAVIPLFTSPYLVISLITILMYVILTLSWTMFSGPTNYISLATAALFGVGVYTSAVLNDFLPLVVVVLIGGLLSFLLALSINHHLRVSGESISQHNCSFISAGQVPAYCHRQHSEPGI